MTKILMSIKTNNVVKSLLTRHVVILVTVCKYLLVRDKIQCDAKMIAI